MFFGVNQNKGRGGLCVLLLVASSFSYAINAGLKEAPVNLQSVGVATFNTNVGLLKSYQLNQNLGRTDKIIVEPVLSSDGKINSAASGAALTSALKQAAGTGINITVLLDSGIYQVDTLAVPKNVVLEGMGQTSTEIAGNSFSSSGLGVSNLSINAGMVSLDSTSRNRNLSITGELSLTSGDITLSDSIVNSSSANGLLVANASNITINNVTVRSKSVGLTISGNPTGVIKNSYFSGASALSMQQNSALAFTNNVLNGTFTFVGDYASSKQHCSNNITPLGTPIPVGADEGNLCVLAKFAGSVKVTSSRQKSSACFTSHCDFITVDLKLSGGLLPYSSPKPTKFTCVNWSVKAINAKEYVFTFIYDDSPGYKVSVTFTSLDAHKTPFTLNVPITLP